MTGDRDYRTVGKFLHAVVVVGFMVVGIEYEDGACLWMGLFLAALWLWLL